MSRRDQPAILVSLDFVTENERQSHAYLLCHHLLVEPRRFLISSLFDVEVVSEPLTIREPRCQDSLDAITDLVVNLEL